MPEVSFIFNRITTEIEEVIKDAKKELFLVSPFIDLSPNIKDELSHKKDDPDFFLRILFGKNDNNYLRSFKKDSLAFLMDFPNIEIKYNERLHAKFYMNDWDCILTSMNLYDYSLNKNIEGGVLYRYKSKSILGKTTDIIGEGIGNVSERVFGEEYNEDPIEKMNEVYGISELLYKTEPILKERKGVFSALKTALTKDEIEGKNVLVNKFEKEVKVHQEIQKKEDSSPQISKKIPSGKRVSLSKISKTINIDSETLKSKLEKEGLINEGKITSSGKELGLEMKNYMGNEYVTYPEDLYVFEN